MVLVADGFSLVISKRSKHDGRLFPRSVSRGL